MLEVSRSLNGLTAGMAGGRCVRGTIRITPQCALWVSELGRRLCVSFTAVTASVKRVSSRNPREALMLILSFPELSLRRSEAVSLQAQHQTGEEVVWLPHLKGHMNGHMGPFLPTSVC